MSIMRKYADRRLHPHTPHNIPPQSTLTRTLCGGFHCFGYPHETAFIPHDRISTTRQRNEEHKQALQRTTSQTAVDKRKTKHILCSSFHTTQRFLITLPKYKVWNYALFHSTSPLDLKLYSPSEKTSLHHSSPFPSLRYDQVP